MHTLFTNDCLHFHYFFSVKINFFKKEKGFLIVSIFFFFVYKFESQNSAPALSVEKCSLLLIIHKEEIRNHKEEIRNKKKGEVIRSKDTSSKIKGTKNRLQRYRTLRYNISSTLISIALIF